MVYSGVHLSANPCMISHPPRFPLWWKQQQMTKSPVLDTSLKKSEVSFYPHHLPLNADTVLCSDIKDNLGRSYSFQCQPKGSTVCILYPPGAAEISQESTGCGQCLLEYLLERLQVESCHVKIKVSSASQVTRLSAALRSPQTLNLTLIC